METKDKATELRKKGKSFREIAKTLQIAVSTAHVWTKHVYISEAKKIALYKKALSALQNSRIKAQKIKREKYVERVNKNLSLGKNIIGTKFSKKEYMLIGASLYWAEGFKKDNRLGFANSDPYMIKLFLFWLENILDVPIECIRLRVGLNFSFTDRVGEIEKYWSDLTEIPLKQFNKAFFQKTKLQKIYPNRDSYYGVLRIRAIGQNDNFRKILGMVEALRENNKK